jgi:hypothetical protein
MDDKERKYLKRKKRRAARQKRREETIITVQLHPDMYQEEQLAKMFHDSDEVVTLPDGTQQIMLRPDEVAIKADKCGQPAHCDHSLSIVCIHLQDGGDEWWGIPGKGDELDWTCGQCLEKFGRGDCPGLEEMVPLCADHIRQMQTGAKVHYPTRNGDGSWRYEEEP